LSFAAVLVLSFATVAGVVTFAFFTDGSDTLFGAARAFDTLAASARLSAARLIAATTAADVRAAVCFGRPVMPAFIARPNNATAPSALSPAAMILEYVSSHSASTVLAAANPFAVTGRARGGIFPSNARRPVPLAFI